MPGSAAIEEDATRANLRALGAVHRGIRVRIPVIPGFNDDERDLEAAARFAREHDLVSVVDNTMASPVVCRPVVSGRVVWRERFDVW